jgi:hypothetical protein
MPLKFLGEPDPMLSMLEWLCHKMMEVKVENKLSAGKGEHSPNRTGYRSGTRVRRFDTRMGYQERYSSAYLSQAQSSLVQWGLDGKLRTILDTIRCGFDNIQGSKAS